MSSSRLAPGKVPAASLMSFVLSESQELWQSLGESGNWRSAHINLGGDDDFKVSPAQRRNH